MKRILIHSLIFSPEGVSTAYLYNDISLKLQEKGYEVVVLTTTPHFNIVPDQVERQPMHWKVWGFCKQSNFHGIKVFHVPQKKFKSTVLRLLGFCYWHIVSFFTALFIRKVDLILSPSPPLTLGWLNLALAWIKRCKVVYNVQEIYPDILKLKGGTTLKLLRWMERKVYNGSDAVTTIDQVFHDTIVGRFKNPEKLHIIPNFVDTDLYHETPWENLLDETLFPRTDSIKLLYAGNIGHMQSWEPLVAMAERTRGMNVEYFVIGEGAKRSYLEEEKERLGLEKLHILPYQPRELMPAILSYSDVSFIFMEPEKDNDGFPSKVYTIMACQRPLLVMSGENTPIVNFLSGKGCAKLITEQNFERKVEETVQWLGTISKDELKDMGKKGLDTIQQNYTKDIVTDMYAKLVDNVLKLKA